jgi:methyl-accepting chemotaxis protein
MIDERFIVSAREIRKEYLHLSNELTKSNENIKVLADFLTEKMSELEDLKTNLSKKVKSKEQLIDFTKKIFLKISEIEEKEKSLTKRINEINTNLEKLRKEETLLMKKLKEKYPNKSNDEIKNEVHSRL